MSTFAETFNVFVKEFGPFASAVVAEQAHIVQRQIETDRAIKPLTQWATDGVRNRPYEEVKKVIFEWWDYRAEIIYAAFEALRGRSPVSSGRYRDSFVALLDGVALRPGIIPTAQQLADVAVVTITNTVPYARRLEVAVDRSGHSFVKQVNPHIVEGAANQLHKDYNTVVTVRFDYVDLDNSYVATTNAFKGRRKDRGRGHAIRYPAIIITRD